jgi:hypothetical protein
MTTDPVGDLEREIEDIAADSAKFPTRLSGTDELMWRSPTTVH